MERCARCGKLWIRFLEKRTLKQDSSHWYNERILLVATFMFGVYIASSVHKHLLIFFDRFKI